MKTLSSQLQLPLFKIGTTHEDLVRRLAELGVDRYAASYKLRKKVITEPGFTDWKFMTFDYDLPKSDDSPIWIEPRALRVTLPKALKPEEFETRLREALKPISLTIWAQSDEGRHHFNALDIDRAIAERYTPYAYGENTRLSRADELYVFRCRADAPRLCRIIEIIVGAYD